MKPQYSGITISRTPGGLDHLARSLDRLVDIACDFSDPSRACRFMEANATEVAFMEIAGDVPAAMQWVRRIKKICPRVRLFLLARSPAPDTILQGFRNGAVDFLPPDPDPDLAGRVKAALDRDGGRTARGELITLFSLKGGMGLTTLAINLADRMTQQTGDRTLVLDLNLFMGDVGGYLDIDPEFTPFDLAADLERMDEKLLFSSIYRHNRGFYVLSAPEEIQDSDSITHEDLAAMAELLKTHFDYVVVDAPHDFCRRTLALLSATDRLLLTVQQSIPSIKAAQKTLEFLDDIRFDPQKIDIVLNRFIKSGDLSPGDLEAGIGRAVDHLIPNDFALCLNAAGRGSTLAQAGAKSRINREIGRLASALTGISAGSPPWWKGWMAGGRK